MANETTAKTRGAVSRKPGSTTVYKQYSILDAKDWYLAVVPVKGPNQTWGLQGQAGQGGLQLSEMSRR